MKVEFFTPSEANSTGGIERAIKGFEQALGERHQIDLQLEGAPKKNTELVHFHGLWNRKHVKAYRFCQKNRIPYIVSPHGMLEPWAFQSKRWKKSLWMKFLGRSQLRHSACTLATSQMEADNLAAFTKQIEIAPLGLAETPSQSREDARQRLGIETDQKIVLYLSRIDRKKGLDLLIDAMADRPESELWVVGDGDDTFLSELKQRHLKNVKWIGAVWGDERWTYLQAADLFCLPTHSENFGFAILEALWVGTPTLTTEKTPWVEHREIDGLNICQDNLTSLKEALASILPGLGQSPGLSEWARSTFHLNVLADRYDEIYQAAIQS